MDTSAASMNERTDDHGNIAVLEHSDSSMAAAVPVVEHSMHRPLGGDEATLPAPLATQVRRQFFCSAVEAARYRVSVDEVIHHLARAGLALGPRPQRVIAHISDVIVAVACVRGDAAAWNDLLNAHAWCLDRACAEQMGSSTGLAFARRFWSDLRAATHSRARGRQLERAQTRLQTYTGTRPIRLWLADRLLGGAASVQSGAMSARHARHLDRERGSRTLPLPTADAGGTAT